MESSKIVGICLLAAQLLAVECALGTFSRTKDEDFQMLIAGGVLPDKADYVRNLVSVRTLHFVEFHGDNHFCTGIIISSRFVVTAAHCVTDRHKSVMSPRGMLIVFGSVFRLEQYGQGDTRRVDRVMVHPKYSRFVRNDVAVLRMVTRIPGNMRNVKPIIKGNKVSIKAGTKCVTLGWGQVYPHGPYANELMFLDVVVRRPKHCASVPKFVSEGNICVQPVFDGMICPGDLGGPLMCQDYLAGIIGGTYGCTSPKAMKFVNFSSVEGWVQTTVMALSATVRKCISASVYLYLLHLI
ncbi:hypothetical protein KR222_000841 [Zaprionus bogoriensis]|nr:hypothetical protein KR222_000841 [Zaprionus bogoriensis]